MENSISNESAQYAIESIAKSEGKTVDEVREEIMKAILYGITNEDPDVQAMWREIPCQGKLPTPEEVIIWIGSKIITP